MSPAVARLLKRYQPIVAAHLAAHHRSTPLPAATEKIRILVRGKGRSRLYREVSARTREEVRRRDDERSVSLRGLKAAWHRASHRERGRQRKAIARAVRAAGKKG